MKPANTLTELEPISLPESQERVLLESVIHNGQQTFLDVGAALLTLRFKKLYRNDFSTFEEYCQKTFGWSAGYGRRLIKAAEVVQSVPIGTIETESQARELAKVEPSKRAEVLTAAGPKPTARQIRAAAQETIRPSSGPVSPAAAASLLEAMGEDVPDQSPEPEDNCAQRGSVKGGQQVSADYGEGNSELPAAELRTTYFYERLEQLMKEAFNGASDKQLVSMGVYAATIPKMIKEKLAERKRKTA